MDLAQAPFAPRFEQARCALLVDVVLCLRKLLPQSRAVGGTAAVMLRVSPSILADHGKVERGDAQQGKGNGGRSVHAERYLRAENSNTPFAFAGVSVCSIL